MTGPPGPLGSDSAGQCGSGPGRDPLVEKIPDERLDELSEALARAARGLERLDTRRTKHAPSPVAESDTVDYD